MSRVWEYNGHEFPFSLADADDYERYVNAVDNLGKKEKELQNADIDTSFIRKYCNMFYQFFDDLFGNGAGEKIFDGRHDAEECERVYYDEFIVFANNQVNEITQNRLGRGKNRAQRRNGNSRTYSQKNAYYPKGRNY